jgi:ketosteroid isomerase-like protein
VHTPPAMSPLNVEAVKRVYERWSQGDFATSIDVMDPLVLLVMRPEFPDAGTYLGIDAVLGYTRGFLDPWPRIAIEAEEITEAGDTVVVAVRQSGVGSESGAATEFGYFHVWWFRGCKAIRLETFRELAEAVEAAGLPE